MVEEGHQSEEYMLSMMEELEADPEIGSDVEMVDADRDDGDDNDAGNDEDSPVEANAEDWLSKADEYEEDSSEDLDRSPLLPPPLPEDEMDQCCSQIEALLLQTSNQQHDEEEPEPVVMACWQQVKLVQIGAPDGVKKVADTLLSREKSSSLTVGRKSNSAKRTLAGAYVVPLDTALDAPGQPQLLSTSDITRIGRGTDTELTIGRNCQFVSRLHATINRRSDGQWIIRCVSKNGLAIGGVDILTDTDYELPGSEIVTIPGARVCGTLSPEDVYKFRFDPGKASMQQEPLFQELLLDHPTVSRQHCRISFDEESSSYFIRDLGSFNGIFLNRVKIAAHTSYQLNVNCEIALGGGKISLPVGSKLPVVSANLPDNTFVFKIMPTSNGK